MELEFIFVSQVLYTVYTFLDIVEKLISLTSKLLSLLSRVEPVLENF